MDRQRVIAASFGHGAWAQIAALIADGDEARVDRIVLAAEREDERRRAEREERKVGT